MATSAAACPVMKQVWGPAGCSKGKQRRVACVSSLMRRSSSSLPDQPPRAHLPGRSKREEEQGAGGGGGKAGGRVFGRLRCLRHCWRSRGSDAWVGRWLRVAAASWRAGTPYTCSPPLRVPCQTHPPRPPSCSPPPPSLFQPSSVSFVRAAYGTQPAPPVRCTCTDRPPNRPPSHPPNCPPNRTPNRTLNRPPTPSPPPSAPPGSPSPPPAPPPHPLTLRHRRLELFVAGDVHDVVVAEGARLRQQPLLDGVQQALGGGACVCVCVWGGGGVTRIKFTKRSRSQVQRYTVVVVIDVRGVQRPGGGVCVGCVCVWGGGGVCAGL